MYTIKDAWDSVMTYFAAFLGIITSEALCNQFIMFGSAILIAVRLLYEVPRVIKSLRRLFK